MKSKKLLVSVAVIIVAVTLALSHTACSERAKITDIFADGYKFGTDYTFTSNSADGLADCTDCAVTADGFVTARSGNYYVLYNIDTNRVVASSVRQITSVFAGLYGITEEDGSTSFYGKNGFIARAEQGQYTVRNSEVAFSDGRVLKVSANGEPYYAGAGKTFADFCIGDYYIEEVAGGDNIYIYDKDNMLVDYINTRKLVGAPEDATVTVVALKNKLVFQVLTEVTEEDADYDFMSDGVKYIYRTYLYDIKKSKLNSFDTDYIMRSNIVYDGAADIFAEYNYAMVYAYKINDDDYLAPLKLCVFNDKLEEVVDLDDYLQGATYIARIDDATTVIANDDAVVFYKGKKFDRMIRSTDITFTSSGYMRMQNKYVDSNLNEVLDMFGREQLFGSLPTDRRIYYAVDGAMFVYNKQGVTVKLGDEYAVYDSCYTITEVTGGISMYHSYNGKAIFMNKHYEAVSHMYRGGYGLIAARSEDGKTEYYSYRLTASN